MLNISLAFWCFCVVAVKQLQPNSASGSGALEHDPSSIYLRVPVGEAIPGPLPLGVSVIDASVALFGVVFPHVSFKHRQGALSYCGDLMWFCIMLTLFLFSCPAAALIIFLIYLYSLHCC